MYPGMMHWWRRHQLATHCESYVNCDPRGGDPWSGYGRPQHEHVAAPSDASELGGRFGVRRPLRFLAYKLELDDDQVAELARILNELKTERAQAEVDGRRAVSGFADAIGAATFDEAAAAASAQIRVQSAERLRGALVKALGRMHALLRPEQRARLAYLIRMGALTL
jgi:Spy/CpxP family protein refolding chaperone